MVLRTMTTVSYSRQCHTVSNTTIIRPHKWHSSLQVFSSDVGCVSHSVHTAGLKVLQMHTL